MTSGEKIMKSQKKKKNSGVTSSKNWINKETTMKKKKKRNKYVTLEFSIRITKELQKDSEIKDLFRY